jgi:hypothetical protein
VTELHAPAAISLPFVCCCCAGWLLTGFIAVAAVCGCMRRCGEVKARDALAAVAGGLKLTLTLTLTRLPDPSARPCTTAAGRLMVGERLRLRGREELRQLLSSARDGRTEGQTAGESEQRSGGR